MFRKEKNIDNEVVLNLSKDWDVEVTLAKILGLKAVSYTHLTLPTNVP